MALVQPVSDKRCISCNRWHGRRRPGEAPDTVEVASAAVVWLAVIGSVLGVPLLPAWG